MVRARILFLVPEAASSEARPILEKERLPYVLKPFQFNDFLEKVSDLLDGNRFAGHRFAACATTRMRAERKRKETRAGHEIAIRQGRRDTGMFAKRDEYVMTEEEIANTKRPKKKNKRKGKRSSLRTGNPRHMPPFNFYFH